MEEFLSLPQEIVFESEIEIKKSRFLAFAKYVKDSEEAEMFVRSLQKKFVDARHVCFAYRLLTTSRFSDDKEPAGTAGKPMLKILENLGAFNVCVVVVRYFGGTKLGAGPLLRAYSQSASGALDGKLVLYEKAQKQKVLLSFKEFEEVVKKSQKTKLVIKDVEYKEMVELFVIFPKSEPQIFEHVLSNEEIFYFFGVKDANNKNR